MKPILKLSLLILAATLALGGCVPSQTPAPATSAPAPAPAATTPPPPTATSAPVAVASADVPGSATAAPTIAVTADLPALRPDALKSYVAHIEMTEEATGSGAAQATPQPPGSVEMSFNSEPAPGAYAWTMTGAGVAGEQAQTSKMIQSGGDTYVFVPEQNNWLKMPVSGNQAMPGLGDVLDPNKLAQDSPAGLFSRENVINRHEDVDGVDTTHYRATPAQAAELIKDTGDPTRTSVGGSADFWVANSNGYLKQYILVVELKDQNGQGLRQTIKMKLSDENKVAPIATPPADQVVSMGDYQQGMATALVQGGTATRAAIGEMLKALPAPPQGRAITPDDLPQDIGALARNALADINQAALFQSGAGRDALRKFYADTLAGQGWQLIEDNPSTDAQMPDQISYGKGSATLTLFIFQEPATKQNYVLIIVES